MRNEGEGWCIRNEQQRAALLDYIEKNKDKDICFKVVQPTRTNQQNKAIYAYCNEVAEQLVARGKDMREVLKPSVEITPTKTLVMDYIWRPIQIILFDKKSTASLLKCEVNAVYEVVSKHLAEKHDIAVRFGR
jgi:hypothetical protein